MRRKPILVILSLLLLAGCRGERPSPEPQQVDLTWLSSLEEARLKAQQTGDFILLSFEASWCPWSRLMRESLYVHGAVVESLASFMCVALEVDRDTTISSEFGIVLYPTTVMTDAYGGEIGRLVGYHTPDEFLEWLAVTRLRQDRLAGMFKQEEVFADDPTFLVSFGKMLLEMGMYDGALIRFDRATQIDEDGEFGTLEEATYSMAECYMLAGEYREAGRRFRLFTDAYPKSERSEQAAVLGAICYEQVNYFKTAADIYEDYLKTSEDGEFAAFVRSKLESLNARSNAGRRR